MQIYPFRKALKICKRRYSGYQKSPFDCLLHHKGNEKNGINEMAHVRVHLIFIVLLFQFSFEPWHSPFVWLFITVKGKEYILVSMLKHKPGRKKIFLLQIEHANHKGVAIVNTSHFTYHLLWYKPANRKFIIKLLVYCRKLVMKIHELLSRSSIEQYPP